MQPAAQPELRDKLTAFLEQDLRKDLLRFTTAGSVDDGKSTLIGRLLHDSKAVYEDQLASVRKSSVNRSAGPIDFALLTDGLRAEREQGITIDVAYRYFATSRRKFIIADTPGHEQYTRNMATGASTADLAVILIDATRGVLPQTRRHAYIAALLGIPIVLAVVNKMDLVEYSQEVFLQVQRDFFGLAAQLKIPIVLSAPVSALSGANVVTRSDQMPWYNGPTFLEHLETAPVRRAETLEALRFPVQRVVRPHAGFRGFAGQVASGEVRPGDSVVALPSGQETRIHSIVTYDGELKKAFYPLSVTVRLEDEIDLSRGDMLVSPERPPKLSRRFEAMVVWFDGKPLEVNKSYLLKHTTRITRARASSIGYRVDVNTLEREPAHRLGMNDIGSVEFESAAPIFFDPYGRNRLLGSFILIDAATNATAGAGMIEKSSSAASDDLWFERINSREIWEMPVPSSRRYERHRHYPAVIFAGERRRLASLLECALFERGFEVLLLPGDQSSQDARALARLALAAGIVLIAPAASAPDTAVLEIAGHRIFNLPAMDLSAEDWEALGQVLLQMKSLFIGEGPVGRGEKA